MFPRLAVVCAAASFLSATAAADSGTMVQVPGGVVDESRHLAYLQNVRAGLDAVELATGRVLWSDSDPQRPLAGANGRLLVERVTSDGVSLCLREARDQRGACATSTRLPLPSWSVGGPSRGRAFDATVEWIGRDAVRYRWSAGKHWSQGMHPPRDRQADDGDPESQTASGAMLVSFKTTKISVSDVGAPPAGSMAYESARGMMRTAWRVDGVWCSLATETLDGVSFWIVRRTGEAGRPLPPLKGGRAGTITPRLSLDGRVLLMPTTRSGPAPSLRLPSGSVGPALNAATLAREFAVSGALLLEGVDAPKEPGSEQPRRALRVTTIDGGLPRWSYPLYVRSAPPTPQ